MIPSDPIVAVRLLDGPLPADAGLDALPADDGVGARVAFDGLVRGLEHGRALLALDYEAYEPMTTRMLAETARAEAAHHHLRGERIVGVSIVHSVGRVPVGACSFRLVVAAAHRKEALEFAAAFIDAMKRHVPLWKVPVFAA